MNATTPCLSPPRSPGDAHFEAARKYADAAVKAADAAQNGNPMLRHFFTSVASEMLELAMEQAAVGLALIAES